MACTIARMSSTPIGVVMVLLSLDRPMVLARSGGGAQWTGRSPSLTPSAAALGVLNLEPSGAAARALAPEISLGFQQVLGVPHSWRSFHVFRSRAIRGLYSRSQVDSLISPLRSLRCW
jgi:hypothetical protein